MKTRLRPKIGTDGRPAVTGEKILYPVAERKDVVRRTDVPGGWEALRGTPEHEIEWQIPSDVDFMDPRPVIHLKPLVMPDGTTVDLNDPRAFGLALGSSYSCSRRSR
jgi:hypothetical protein